MLEDSRAKDHKPVTTAASAGVTRFLNFMV
jgi:hypothetical protein